MFVLTEFTNVTDIHTDTPTVGYRMTTWAALAWHREARNEVIDKK